MFCHESKNILCRRKLETPYVQVIIKSIVFDKKYCATSFRHSGMTIHERTLEFCQTVIALQKILKNCGRTCAVIKCYSTYNYYRFQSVTSLLNNL
jgi:hypothetical protein